MKCLLVLSRTNSVELNKKTEIVEPGIFVAEKTIAKVMINSVRYCKNRV